MSSSQVPIETQGSIYQLLTPPQWRDEMLSFETLLEQTARGKWNHSPAHQREVVHNDAWGQRIYESAIGFGEIPPLVFHPRYTSTGVVFDSIDGKQRASKILEGLQDKFKLKFSRPELAHISNKYFSELSELQQSEIKNLTLRVRIANRTLTDDEIYELFTNLQHNKRTTKGETLNAMPSEANGLVNETVEDLAESFERVIPKNTRKQRTEMAIRMYKSWCFPQDDSKAMTEKPKLLDWFKTATVVPDAQLFKQAVATTLNILEQCSLKHTQAQSTIMPIFRVLSHYIHTNPDSLTLVKDYIVGLEPDYFNICGGDHNAVVSRFQKIKNDLAEAIKA
jgi:hypothetical protein